MIFSKWASSAIMTYLLPKRGDISSWNKIVSCKTKFLFTSVFLTSIAFYLNPCYYLMNFEQVDLCSTQKSTLPSGNGEIDCGHFIIMK